MPDSTSTARRTVILGTTPLAMDLVGIINGSADSRYRLLGLVGESANATGACPILGSLDDLERIFAEQRPACVITALAERRRRLPVQQLVSALVCRGLVVQSGEEVYERLTGKLAIDSLTPSSVIFSREYIPSSFALGVARALSLLVAAFGLIAAAPLCGLIALAIRLDSAGPALFVQDRVGLGGRPFRMLKFRTMYPAAHPRSEWVADNDDRITPVGRWLRRFRFDELPQLINVLRGDMNLVGPRPHPVSNYQMFTLVSRNMPECGGPIPYYSLRSLVRPGITGWAQVRYRYANDLDEEMEKMRYDLYYIKHHSILLDLRILFETIKVVCAGREPVRAPPRTLPSTAALVVQRAAVNRPVRLASSD